MKRTTINLMLALLLAASGLRATALPTTAFTVTGFTVNPAFILNVYNSVQQNNGNLTQWPADLVKFNSVVQIGVVNTSNAAAKPYFSISVSDPGCGQIINTNPTGLFTTINPVNPGPATLGAASFQTAGAWSGLNVGQCFQDEVKNNFSDPSKVDQAVKNMMRIPFTICIQQTDASGNPVGSPVCTVFNFFNQQSGNITMVPTLISPSNNEIFSLPMFTWTPATKQGVAPGQITYRLELTENEPLGDPIRVTVPAPGQTFYQWSAADRELKIGTKYYWRAIGLDTTGNPIGGTNDSGWNVTKWFVLKAGQQGAITLRDVDAIVQKAIQGNKDQAKALAKLQISSVSDPANLADDIYSQLKNGQATVSGVDVSTK